VCGNEIEKVKVKYIKATIMKLACFDLLEQGLEQDVYRNDVKAFVESRKVAKHHFSDVHFPVELN
jgi:hypothetical protein